MAVNVCLNFVDRWRNQPVLCAATGPSLTQEDCYSVTQSGIKTIAVSDSYRMLPRADVVYACDHRWWSHHNTAVLRLDAERWSMDEAANSEFGTRLVHAVREKGLCTEAGKIHHGTNSGHQAINLAYQFGARIVILIGYDMQHTDEKRHFFGDHPKGWGNANHVVRWRESMKTLAEDAKKAGLRVINSSRETALDCFERMTLEEALQCAQS